MASFWQVGHSQLVSACGVPVGGWRVGKKADPTVEKDLLTAVPSLASELVPPRTDTHRLRRR